MSKHCNDNKMSCKKKMYNSLLTCKKHPKKLVFWSKPEASPPPKGYEVEPNMRSMSETSPQNKQNIMFYWHGRGTHTLGNRPAHFFYCGD